MTETVEFVVLLYGTFWKKKPQYSIAIDNTVVFSGRLNRTRNNAKEIKFKQTLAPGKHTLNIRLENKTSADTIINDGSIVDDMLLNIGDIVIDDISLCQMLYDGIYLLDEPQLYNGKVITKLNHCINLGWNGTYQFSFESPFRKWLFEKL